MQKRGIMGLQQTMVGDRLQIAFLGKRNAGKSSLLNALTGQQVAIVSEVKGTTTDPVSKAMEILPLGPCLLVDTPGLDDEGELGQKRMQKTRQELRRTDLALVVMDAKAVLEGADTHLEDTLFTELIGQQIRSIVVFSHADVLAATEKDSLRERVKKKYDKMVVAFTDSASGNGVEELKQEIAKLGGKGDRELHIVSDLMDPGDVILLVVPIDSAAPKGRLIMPQQQTIRDILDHHGIGIVCQVEELADTLDRFKDSVKLVITDSQAFAEVGKIVPQDLALTSFSILFARHKGQLDYLVQGVSVVESLQDGDRILIAEGCTHKRQCEDIGTVKIPNWLKQYTGKELQFTTCSGRDFPENLTGYKMVVHCGACTLQEREMQYRIRLAKEQKVPMVNYGILISFLKGILSRSIQIFPETAKFLETIQGGQE